MILVVADTSPINYLVLVGATHVLPKLFDEVAIPKTVLKELSNPKAPKEVQAFVAKLPSWITVHTGVTGTIGILERAAEAGLVDLKEVLSRLSKTSFQVSDALIQAALMRRKKDSP